MKVSISENIRHRNLVEELKQSYLDYAMSVIVGRALPDVRDGLKPVQRRILYAMYDMGNLPDRPYKKSARVVGEVLGKYHPHGDAAVYDALVRMAQDFNMRYPLIDGQGNFGSMDGDSAAAMRYTEVRLKKIAMEMLRDIDKDTVDMVPNFDGTLKEPTVLPTLLPNLLVNGSSGIAVGMSTSIPPHNLGEVVDALIKVLRNEHVTIDEIMGVLPAPDFPTGGVIDDPERLREIYKKGRGIFHLRGKWRIEDGKGGRKLLVIKEIPYQVNKAKLVESIAQNIASWRLPGADEVRDESNRHGVRIVIELKRGASPNVIIDQLLRYTNLRISYSVIFVAIVNGMPKQMSIIDILKEFISFRREIVARRAQYDLKKAEERHHIVLGLLRALDMIDEIISFIRGSESAEDAKSGLIEVFGFSEAQAAAILNMRLQRLAKLERNKLEDERHKLEEIIAYNKRILSDPTFRDDVIERELKELKDKYADERRTVIGGYVRKAASFPSITQRVEVLLGGYIRRTDPSKPIHEECVMWKNVPLNGEVMLITNHGRALRIEVAHLPEAKRGKRGIRIDNIFNMAASETIIGLKVLDNGKDILLITAGGRGKIVTDDTILTSRGRVVTVMSLMPGDEIVFAEEIPDNKDQIVVVTENGKAARYRLEEISVQGMSARGSKLMKLQSKDMVADADFHNSVDDSALVFTMTRKGYGKATPVEHIPLRHRGSGGVILQKVDSNTGKVVFVKVIDDDVSEIKVITDERVWTIPRNGDSLPVMGRGARGRKIMKGNVKVLGKVMHIVQRND